MLSCDFYILGHVLIMGILFMYSYYIFIIYYYLCVLSLFAIDDGVCMNTEMSCVCVQLKQMEVQLEEEYDEKQKVLKEKRELESKLLTAQDKVTTLHTARWITSLSKLEQSQMNFAVPVSQVRCDDIETEKRLRKDLKRTKALLADAQIMLDHIKNNAPSKREIAQLKNQVQP